jgi:putative hydrolase
MEPVSALQRVAYLLEAQNEPTFKVKAFRRVAAVIAELDPDRVAALAGTGRLEDLAGIGKTTAQLIKEAVGGSMPAYLAQLEEDRPPPPGGEVGRLLAALVGDCHSHSDWSDGGSPIAEMAAAARDRGLAYLVLTDHSPRLTVAHGLSPERLVEQLEIVAEVDRALAPFRLLCGIEVDILEDGSLDQDPELLGALDLVVASVHSKLRMESRPMTARMLAAIESPHTDVLGHCTGRLIVGRGRSPSAFDADAVFAACARTGTAVEINSRPDRRDPPPELLARAIEAGCLFAIDSDAHAPGQLEWPVNGCEQAVEAGVPAERVVNTWPVDRLLAWTAGHGALTTG